MRRQSAVTERLLIDRRLGGRVVVLTLHRPDRLNAFDTQLGLDLLHTVEELQDDAKVRCIVLTGAGERAFCVGADLKERRGMTDTQWRVQHRIFEKAHRAVRESRRPTIAAVNGYALGGGCELALSCDFVVAAESASFGTPEVKRGIIPGVGGTQLLPRLAPRGMALAMLMTGDTVSARRASELGLVVEVAAAGTLLDVAVSYATRIAANSPQAVWAARRALRVGLDANLEASIEAALPVYEGAVAHPDREEGVSAFNEGREPVFQDLP